MFIFFIFCFNLFFFNNSFSENKEFLTYNESSLQENQITKEFSQLSPNQFKQFIFNQLY